MNKKRLKWAVLILAILIVEILIALKIEPGMEGVGEALPAVKELFGIPIPGGVNYTTIITTWVAMVIIMLFSWLITRKLKKVPSKLQVIAEMAISSLDRLCEGSLGSRRRGRVFLPFIGTLFIFVLVSNWLPVAPIPGLQAPTRDLNTTLALALLCFSVAHVSGMKYMGFKSYLLGYFEPMVEVKGVKIPNIFMAVLNIIGEFGKVISHSFRLFGNVLGGAIIILILSNLLHHVVLPIILYAFFDLFIGALQAFIFGILGLTYISLLAREQL